MCRWWLGRREECDRMEDDRKWILNLIEWQTDERKQLRMNEERTAKNGIKSPVGVISARRCEMEMLIVAKMIMHLGCCFRKR